MKMKSFFFALLMVVTTAVMAVGNDDPGNDGLAVVSVKGSEVFKVIYQSESASRIKLSVYNASSEVVFSETMNGIKGFIRPLNFNGLQFGEYTIELIDASGKKTERVNYQPVRSESTIHISRLGNDQGQFLLSVEKNNSKSISVRIFDGANNLLHSSTQAVALNYAQLYKLKHVSGSVVFEVSDNAGNITTARF